MGEAQDRNSGPIPRTGKDNGVTWTPPKAGDDRFTATPTRAEHGGYLAATQTPDGVIHLIGSRLHYRLNLAWLVEGTSKGKQK